MASVNFRLAVETDFPAVLDMSQGVYSGNDYFSCEFLNFLNDPKRKILIAEKDGNVVGLEAIQIVDDGETAIAQALRVHREYRCQGIGKQLIQECRNYVKEHFPKVKYERYSVTSEAVESLHIRKKSDDVLFHQAAFFACFVNSDESELASRLARRRAVGYNNVKQLSETEFQSVLEQENLENILFKGKYIVHWKPFEPLVSNISNGLIAAGDSLFASFSGESIESLSHSRWCPVVKCPQLFTVCYTLDKELLKAHVVKQLENAILQHPFETFLLVCLVDTSLVDSTYELLLNYLSLKNLNEHFQKYHVSFFEKSLV